MTSTAMQAATFTEHESCRSCGGVLLAVMSLGLHPLPDFGQTEPDWRYAPLDLVQCRRCELVQLRHTVARDEVFRKYWYRSGISETMRTALRELAEAVTVYGQLQDGDKVLDIGSNDDTFLGMLPTTVKRAGFEPSDIEGPIIDGLVTFREYFNAQRWLDYFRGAKAKVITTTAMFYSVPEPDAFVHDVARVLAADGVWVCQMNDLLAMVENTAYDIIGHEHVCIWSLKALEPLLARHGLGVFRVERNGVNGGSIRLYIQHQGGPRSIELSVPAQREAEAGIDLWHFSRNVMNACSTLRDLLYQAKTKGASIYLKGASTRGCTIVNASVIAPLLDGAIDRDERKHGYLFPGTNLRIVSEEEGRQADIMVVLPYSYLAQFQEREKDWLASSGRFVIPVPKVCVV